MDPPVDPKDQVIPTVIPVDQVIHGGSGSGSVDLIIRVGGVGGGAETPQKQNTPSMSVIDVTEDAIARGLYEDRAAWPTGIGNAIAKVLHEAWVRIVWMGWAGATSAPTRGVGADIAEIHRAIQDGATPCGILDAWRGVGRHTWLESTRASGNPAASIRTLLHTGNGRLYEELRVLGAQHRAAGDQAALGAAENAWLEAYRGAFELVQASRREPTQAEIASWERRGSWAIVGVLAGCGEKTPVYGPPDRTGWNWQERSRGDAAIRSLTMAAGNVAAGRVAGRAVAYDHGEAGAKIAAKHAARIRAEFDAACAEAHAVAEGARKRLAEVGSTETTEIGGAV